MALMLLSLAGTGLAKAPSLEQTAATVTCSFGKHSSEKDKRRLAFTNGKTTKETWSLDGMIRATNSNYWYEVVRHFNSTVFVGDAGETLSVTAPKGESFGVYEAVVHYTQLGYFFRYSGQCSLKR